MSSNEDSKKIKQLAWKEHLQAFSSGFKAAIPVALGVIPFGLVAGAGAISKGLGWLEGLSFSVFIFAGASQLAVLELLSQNAPLIMVLVTGWIINLRFMIYSAAIAPFFKGTRLSSKILGSYLLTDQAYIITQISSSKEPTMKHVPIFYFGVASTFWILWQASTLIGIFAGKSVPSKLNLDFAIPLVFLSLLISAVKNRPGLIAALVSGLGVYALASLPMNLGFAISVPLGVIAGFIMEKRFKGASL